MLTPRKQTGTIKRVSGHFVLEMIAIGGLCLVTLLIFIMSKAVR